MSQEYNDVFTKSVEARIKAIETAVDQIWYMIQNTISKEQFNRINVIRQRQISQIDSRITTLTSDVSDLEDQLDAMM